MEPGVRYGAWSMEQGGRDMGLVRHRPPVRKCWCWWGDSQPRPSMPPSLYDDTRLLPCLGVWGHWATEFPCHDTMFDN